jgi:hypothetical protein
MVTKKHIGVPGGNAFGRLVMEESMVAKYEISPPARPALVENG